MDLDDILGALHGDRAGLLEAQLRAIEKEIAHRRLIGSETTLRLWEDIATLTDEILRFAPRNPQEADVDAPVRHGLERERRLLHQELHDEIVKTWQAVQELKREQRQLLAELASDRQRYDRFTRDYET